MNHNFASLFRIKWLFSRTIDTLKLYRIFNVRQKIQFTYLLLQYAPAILRTPSGALSPVIRSMGEGPYRIPHPAGNAILCGEQVLGSVLEIWIRDIYRDSGKLNIRPGSVIVDLGANIGAFTVFAALFTETSQVIAVEAQEHLCEKLNQNIQGNHLTDKAMIVHGIVGPHTGIIVELMQNPGIAQSIYSFSDLMSYAKIDHIDFLKIDIEGSEFDLFDREPDLLNYVDQLAMEVHTNISDIEPLVELCKTHNMTCWTVPYGSNATMLYAQRNE